MNILVTNDDGWGFAGIEALTAVAREHGSVWVVAPAQPMSGISHQLTFEQPMTLLEKGERSFSLTGTPADCVRVAMVQLGVSFDWVLSGINNGANLGADIFISGTVAAAREATFFGARAVAISQYLQGFRQDFEWQRSVELTARILPSLMDSDIESGQYYNVNLPDTHGGPVDEIELVHTQADRLPLPAEYRALDNDQIIYCGSYKHRERTPGKDIDACFNGKASITLQ